MICHSGGTSVQISRKWCRRCPWVFAICHTLCLKLKSSKRKALAFTTRQIERQGPKNILSMIRAPEKVLSWPQYVFFHAPLLLQNPMYGTFRNRSTSFMLEASKYSNIVIRYTSLSSQHPPSIRTLSAATSDQSRRVSIPRHCLDL